MFGGDYLIGIGREKNITKSTLDPRVQCFWVTLSFCLVANRRGQCPKNIWLVGHPLWIAKNLCSLTLTLTLNNIYIHLVLRYVLSRRKKITSPLSPGEPHLSGKAENQLVGKNNDLSWQVDGNEWQWKKINEWQWVAMSGNDWKWMSGIEWQWMVINEQQWVMANEWQWVEIDEWVEMNGNEWVAMLGNEWNEWE